MKRFVLISLVAAAALMFTGCGKDKSTGSSEKAEIISTGAQSPTDILSVDDGYSVSYESVLKYFDVKYEVQTPEDNSQSGKVARSGGDSGGGSESVVPGVRGKLSDYETKYVEKRDKATYVAPAAEEIESADPNAAFVVKNWGPKKSVVSESEFPNFFVMFSEPVKALTALEAPTSTSDIVTITPPLKGVFRWYGTKHLAFEAEEPADPSQSYTIKVKSGLKSLAGKTITGNTVFNTTAEDIKILNLWGGYIKNSDQAYGWDSGALPPYENRFLVRFNYKLTAEQVMQNLEVSYNNRKANFTVEGNYDPEVFRWWNKPDFSKEENKTNTYIVTITDQLPHNVNVVASVKKSHGRKFDYSTLKPFTVTGYPTTTDYTSGNKAFPLHFYFSQAVDPKTVPGNISFDFDFTLKENENFEVYGNSLTIFNLPVDFEETHKFYIKKNLKDVYGQSLGSEIREAFDVPSALSYARFIDYGTKMMEAKYPHKIIFEYQNILPGSFYRIRPSSNPYSEGFQWEHDYSGEEGYTPVEPGVHNKRAFKEINLDPYLTNGYGFVNFIADMKTKTYRWWSEEYEDNDETNNLTVQVTDLGITTRLGMNKAVVMVRRLSTGEPVANADVYLIGPDAKTAINLNSESNILEKGKTDSNGYTRLNFSERTVREITEDNWHSSFAILVKDGDDKAYYVPDSHSPWTFDVDSSSMKGIRKPVQRTFMFVDRGIYRPGETVTFRGIDKDQLLGTLKVHKGDYSITSRGNWWDSENIIEPICGTLSENGGFYGSFKIPDDADPGYYMLNYKRNDESYERSIIYQIAEFERVKIQANIEIPDLNYYGGDKVTSSLSADYLAGGVLNGAAYQSSWYRKKTSFNPSTVETEGYTFGPEEDYSSWNLFDQKDGQLSSLGTAALSCSTEKITDGASYSYRSEAYITDVSNQQIFTSAIATVHPASFYAGVARPKGLTGFAKKDQKLDFPYLLVDVKGNVLGSNGASALENAVSLEYKLTREDWTMVHEQSVYNTIYTRYECSTVEEASGIIDTKKASGTLQVTPKSAGYYTLTLTGYDLSGRKVVTEYSFYVTGGYYSWYNTNNANAITLTPDRNEYNPGDKAQILMNSPLPAGDYIITVEREGIFTDELRHIDSPTDVIEIPVSQTYVPVVYVSVSSYSNRTVEPTNEYGDTDLDKPKGYYGVTKLFVNPYVRSFALNVEYDKPTYEPGDTATIKLTATKGGKPYPGAELTLMAIDRGILDLINYHVQDPVKFFYDPYNYSLSVSGGDSRDLLMDPVTYSIKYLQGGDADNEKDDERKDFRPTAVFEPVLVTGKDGTVSCSFKVPDSLTTYRVTVFGVKEDLFALKEDEFRVQNPINIQAVQPRQLRERDTAECGVLITNLDKNAQNVTVSLEVRSPTGDTEQDKLEGRKTVPGKAFVDGKATHKVKVASGDSTVVYFDVGAKKSGTVELVYTINSEILNEKLISPLKIEKTYVYETVTMTGATDTSVKEQIVLPAFAEDNMGDLKVTLDATRLGMLGSSVNYLFEYPYGCLEQQSSRVLPLVIFEEYIDVFGLDSKIVNVRDCVLYYTNKWKNCQLSNGGFPYWPERTDDSYYVSLRIGEICGAAMKRGYTADELGIDINALARYIKDALDEGNNWVYSYKPYALYVLELLGSGYGYYLDDCVSKYEAYSLTDEAYIALAVLERNQLRDKAIAEEILEDISSYLQPVERSVTVLPKDNENGLWTRLWWNSSREDELSLLLKLYSELIPEDEMVDRMLNSLMMTQKSGYWHNTITTAKVLDGVYAYIKGRNLDDTNYTGTAKINGAEIMKESFTGVNAKPKSLALTFADYPVKDLNRETGIPMEFSKEGSGHLYYTVEMKYALPDEMQWARDEGLKIKYEIRDYETGKLINPENMDSSVINLETGKTYRAVIRLETHRDRNYVALRAPVPAGAEILDSSLATTGSSAEMKIESDWGHWLDAKYIRDSEVQFFWDDFNTGSTTVEYTFRAARRGVYVLPPVQAECMYEPEVFGRSDGYLSVIK